MGDHDVIYFDEMADSLTGYTEGTVAALEMGYALGKQDGGSNAVLDYLKTDLSDRVTGIGEEQKSAGTKLAAATSAIDAKLVAQNAKAAADFKTFSDALNEAVTEQLEDADTAVKEKLGKVTALDASVVELAAAMKTQGECITADTDYDPVNKKCCSPQSQQQETLKQEPKR